MSVSLNQRELQDLAIARLRETGRIPPGGQVEVWTSGGSGSTADTTYTLKLRLRLGESIKGGPIEEDGRLGPPVKEKKT